MDIEKFLAQREVSTAEISRFSDLSDEQRQIYHLKRAYETYSQARDGLIQAEAAKRQPTDGTLRMLTQQADKWIKVLNDGIDWYNALSPTSKKRARASDVFFVFGYWERDATTDEQFGFKLAWDKLMNNCSRAADDPETHSKIWNQINALISKEREGAPTELTRTYGYPDFEAVAAKAAPAAPVEEVRPPAPQMPIAEVAPEASPEEKTESKIILPPSRKVRDEAKPQVKAKSKKGEDIASYWGLENSYSKAELDRQHMLFLGRVPPEKVDQINDEYLELLTLCTDIDDEE